MSQLHACIIKWDVGNGVLKFMEDILIEAKSGMKLEVKNKTKEIRTIEHRRKLHAVLFSNLFSFHFAIFKGRIAHSHNVVELVRTCKL